MTSRYIQVRPDNVNPDASISFKSGFPVLSFTIQSQQGILDPTTIRINGDLQIFKDNVSPVSTPCFTDDPVPNAQGGGRINMDSRLGVFALWDQLVIRHNKSKQICEHIRHYNKYLSSYLGATSSRQDLVGHLNETCLTQPNQTAMYRNVVASSTLAQLTSIRKSFSCHLPSGFIMSGNRINLMENSFGGIQIEIHLSPDSNCLFSDSGDSRGIQDAHYELSNLNLSCEVMDLSPEELSVAQSQTEGALEFNTISSLYTSINTGNAQLQYSLGLRNLQSVFMTFTPSANINTLVANGLATTYPANADGALVSLNRVQFLRGGQKYPVEFDMTGNTNGFPQNQDVATISNFNTADSQLLKQYLDAILPEFMLDRTSVSPLNLNRNYTMTQGLAPAAGVLQYKSIPDGGAQFGIGMRYSQFNKGQDFSTQQWGCSIDSTLSTNSPQSVFLYFKARALITWNSNGINLQS
tara:strand:- start:783 stop:2183 length:1401 start_codon:yes stop_codon:yes gene_type:complete